METQRTHRSVRLWTSYIIDWIVLIIIGVLAYVFNLLTPHYHDFSLLDLSISYPLKPDTVPIWVAGVVAALVPAVVIPIVSFLFVPAPSLQKGRTWGQLIKLKLWEWHAGWLGLAMSLTTAIMITQALKNFGKPRPNALARCEPDLDNIAQYTVGGFGQMLSKEWVMVTHDICTQKDAAILKDGFQSWPSGHSSTSWSGLLYLSLYLASKFSAVLPYLPPMSLDRQGRYKRGDLVEPIRNRDEAAAPPVYMIFFFLVPCGGALYICVSRYMDYAHHGFDIISGSVIGILCAYFSFRWYHLPLAQGSGWSWGPRSPDRAFGVGVGLHGYVDEDRFAGTQHSDMEMGLIVSNGTESHRDK